MICAALQFNHYLYDLPLTPYRYDPYKEKQRCSGSYRRAVGVQVFKDDSISQRPGLRRWGSRFTVNARRNLPVKEFCYLRTVNLTAAMCFNVIRRARGRYNGKGVEGEGKCIIILLPYGDGLHII